MANKKLNGIVIEIGGDTSKLDEALKGVESETKKAKAELRDVNYIMKKSPESAVLWQQKQELLTKAFDESYKKLSLLNKSQKSLSQQLADGDIDQKRYDKFQEKIKKTRSKLEELTKQQGDFKQKLANNEIDQGAYDEFKKKISKTAEELKNLESSEKSLEERVKIGDVSEEQYRAFQREVEKTKNEAKYFGDELRNLKNSADSSSDEVEDLGNAAEEAGEKAEDSGNGGFTILKGAVANLAAEGIKKAIDGFKELAEEGDTALNTLQTRTGATAQEMDEYKDIMQNIYAENFGENRTDIASSISEVKQQLGDIDSGELEDVTKTALLLRDTFDFEVNESVRAANMLMKQFGITSDEAYTLIAQGAQNGLNKNGDLLDTINEYSVHYKQQGYSAEQFFNSLVNGTSAGTFSVDKLGDAMKEFGVRTKDTADSTTEGFSLIGLSAGDMRRKFAQGGEAAQEATRETLNALFSLNDQVKQNQAGVDLFGTMWEDLGIDGVKALMNVNGEADKTKSTLQDIADVKYNDLGSQLEQTKRQLKTELLEPIAEKYLPKIKNSTDWLVKNLPNIKRTASDLVPMIKSIGSGFATWKIASTAGKSASALKGLISLIKNTGATAMSTSTLVKGVVIATAATATAVSNVYEKQYKSQHEAMIELESYKNECKDAANKLNDLKESSYKTADAELEQTKRSEALWKELQTLADHSGNVKKKDEERVQYIIKELQDATKVEIDLVDGQIQKYDELRDKIEDVIAKQKAEVYIDSYSEVAVEARSQASEAQSEYYDAKKKYESLKAKDDKEYEEKYKNDPFGGGVGIKKYSEETQAAKIKMDEAEIKFNNAADTLSKYQKAMELFAEDHCETVGDVLYADTKAMQQDLRAYMGTSDKKEEIFNDMCDRISSDLRLANQSNSKELQQSAVETMVNLVAICQENGLTSGIKFSSEFKSELQTAIDAGINFDAFILAAADAGWNIGELLGQAAVERYNELIAEQLRIETQQLYANNNLITHSINSPSDAALFRKGDYTLGVSKHATGGLIRYGEGIVAEAGPELIQVMQGGVRVTPLTATARNHAVDDLSKGQRVFYNNITVNVAKVSSDYDVNRIAQQLAAEQKRIERGRGRW